VPRVIGIDEAGYGPTLGPLVVGATFWNVSPKHVKADFWEVLQGCVLRTGKRGEWRLLVDDSKSVFNRKKGISTLERAVLAFARAAGGACDTLSGFLAGLGVDLAQPDPLPWYRELEIPLPLGGAASKFQAVAERLTHAMNETGLICRGLAAAVVTEDQFNLRVNQTRNKAAVLIEQVLRIIDRAGRQGGDEDLIVRVDRLGGREDYRPLLAAAFPERHLHIIDQSEECSRYRLAGERNDWYVEFAVDADKHHLPVALGSMVAKYVREALMTRFNAYWHARCPALRPTAGYYTDAQRFLADLGPELAAGPLSPERFIRSR
jgi:hypothetical protein